MTLRTRLDRAALSMLAAWMGEHYFRTFRLLDGGNESPSNSQPFDAVLGQRELRASVTIGALWETPAPDAAQFEQLIGGDIGVGAYALWVPPAAALPREEPQQSAFRLRIANGMKGLEPGERREVRLPATLLLAKTDAEGQYVSVTGALSSHWTRISEGVSGAFQLDSRALHRLPEEEAELELLLSRVRDRAALLNVEERTEVDVHDHWLVSRLPADGPAGVTVAGSSPDFDPSDGAALRRLLRGHIRRAVEQQDAGQCDFSVLLLIASPQHIEDEMATTAVRGMSPTTYGSLDLIVLVADGRVRQVLQPRSLPWGS
ncbi:MAG: hypothetical protein QF664_11360 [Dehalococcoidia bacterium]|jgi:hypothetical protein|nr:hypothetical protein [Dehalococcoidia bacterium]